MAIYSPTPGSSSSAWRRLRPSLLGLLLTGFALALLPLAGALGVAGVYVNRLARQSQVAVVQAVEATQGGRQLLGQITAMERNIRQYLVLENELLLNVYRETHQLWRDNLTRLTALNLEPEQRAILDRLGALEQTLFEQLGGVDAKPQENEQVVEQFVRARGLVRDFLNQSNDWVDREVVNLRAQAEETTHLLGGMMAAVIPAVLLLAGVFTALIARPLRLLTQAIQRLGNEDFTTPAVVRGARDLEQLGERLDWLRHRLAEAEAQKTRFLHHVSHELKNPLTSLREGADLLCDEVVGPLAPAQREVATILRDNSLRMQRLIEDLLNFNEALSRHLPLRREPVDLAALVAQVVEGQQLACKARDLRIALDVQPAQLSADRDKLTTILENLLSNAIKFSPVGGTIRVGLAAEGKRVRLSVRDEGPGFDPADGEHVFEAFYRGRAAAAGPVKGSGLGLAIAREYARAHGGHLWIQNHARPGACVGVDLPRSAAA